ncbi:MAG: hypothetical protein JNK76_01285 [Planctomycetales bacterium]|nr:hypothetical protein [Planctomycetales bacterium]
MQSNQPNPADSLSSERMQQFALTLAHLPPDEVRKAKLLYIKNAIAEFRTFETTVSSFAQMQGCMSIVPIFWPIIKMQKKMINAQVDLARQRIMNAIDVWRDDLQAAGFDVTKLDLSGSADRPPDERQRFTVE